MESTNVNLITLLRDRVGELCGEGDFSEALDVANAAVGKAEKELSGEVDSIEAFAAALEVRGDLLRSTGEYEKARDDYRQAIDKLEGRHDLCIQLGRRMEAGGEKQEHESRQGEQAVHRVTDRIVENAEQKVHAERP